MLYAPGRAFDSKSPRLQVSEWQDFRQRFGWARKKYEPEKVDMLGHMNAGVAPAKSMSDPPGRCWIKQPADASNHVQLPEKHVQHPRHPYHREAGARQGHDFVRKGSGSTVFSAGFSDQGAAIEGLTSVAINLILSLHTL